MARESTKPGFYSEVEIALVVFYLTNENMLLPVGMTSVELVEKIIAMLREGV